ncbi:hypothetical protein ABIF74_011831 [Bradyrhizobium japonicum]
MTLEFVGRPLRKFYDLHGETIYRLVNVANVRSITDPTEQSPSGETNQRRLSPKELEALEDAIKTVRDLASQMRAFAFNETLALHIVCWFGYDPEKASAAMIGLSNTMATYNAERVVHRESIKTALKIRQFV